MKRPEILIADNDSAYLESMRSILETSGYLVVSASNPSQARQILESENISLAILDLRMVDDSDPHDISGLSLAEVANTKIPKIILSGYPTLDVVREALAANIGLPSAADFLNKAEDIKDLPATVKTHLRMAELAAHSSQPVHGSEGIKGQSLSSCPLRVFLCHSSADKPFVRDLYNKLEADGFDPWLDEKKLLPGQDWQLEIKKAVGNSDIVIVCLSRTSVSKKGYVQTEIRIALDVADEQPEGTIFIIPLKLEECQIPDRLRRWQWVNYFEANAYDKLLLSLKHRASEILS